MPRAELELFFDIEVDPMRDVCYLHGFIERRHRNNETERFIAFFADEPTAEAERQAFEAAWRYLRERQSYVMYYYSKYERTIYRKLREKYPDVCTEEELKRCSTRSGRSIFITTWSSRPPNGRREITPSRRWRVIWGLLGGTRIRPERLRSNGFTVG